KVKNSTGLVCGGKVAAGPSHRRLHAQLSAGEGEKPEGFAQLQAAALDTDGDAPDRTRAAVAIVINMNEVCDRVDARGRATSAVVDAAVEGRAGRTNAAGERICGAV